MTLYEQLEMAQNVCNNSYYEANFSNINSNNKTEFRYMTIILYFITLPNGN